MGSGAGQGSLHRRRQRLSPPLSPFPLAELARSGQKKPGPVTMTFSRPPALETSEALHQAVRKFADDSLHESGLRALEAEPFEALALRIAAYQREQSPGFARIVKSYSGKLESLADIPLVPTDAFRLTRVATHPKELDRVVFETSGTTSAETGRHPFRDLRTKEHLSLLQAKQSLFTEQQRGIVVALAQAEGNTRRSSLVHLMELFMEHFDGRALSIDPKGAAYRPQDPARFLVNSAGIDVDGLERACRIARARSEPLFLLTTSFALAGLLETLEGRTLKAPTRTRIMLTGGFKGREHDLDETQLRRQAARALGTGPEAFLGEYGMTELTSQLFEDPKTGLYQAPPWLRVRAIEPHTWRVLPDGEPGLAHFIDLGNVDSCLSVLTQDRCTTHGTQVRLLGRAERAPARGCSLPYETYLGPRAVRGTSPHG